LKGQEIKARLRKFERETEPFKVKAPRRTWIISASGKDGAEADVKLEARIENIKAGKERHPDGRLYEERDTFMSIRVIESNDGEKYDVEGMFHSILKGERSGGPPGPTEDEEIESLERQIKELEGLMEAENVDSK